MCFIARWLESSTSKNLLEIINFEKKVDICGMNAVYNSFHYLKKADCKSFPNHLQSALESFQSMYAGDLWLLISCVLSAKYKKNKF